MKKTLLLLLIVLCALSVKAIYIPPVGEGVCVPAPGMPCDTSRYASPPSYIDEECDEDVRDSVGSTLVQDTNPCKNTRLRYCMSKCLVYRNDVARPCIEACVDVDREARIALNKCVAAMRAQQTKAKQPASVATITPTTVKPKLVTPTTVRPTSVTPTRISATKIQPTDIRVTPVLPTPIQSTFDKEPWDFDLRATPATLSIPSGGQAWFTITGAVRRGKAQPVTLSLGGTGLASLVREKAMFGIDGQSSATATPPINKKVLIKTRAGQRGTYNLAVLGVSGNLRKVANFRLVVG